MHRYNIWKQQCKGTHVQWTIMVCFFTDVLALLQLACFNYTDTLIAGKHFALTSAALSNLLLGMSPTQTHH